LSGTGEGIGAFSEEYPTTKEKPHRIRPFLASDFPIKRHVKVRSDANPYDPAYESYFEKRVAEPMQDTFRAFSLSSLSLVSVLRATSESPVPRDGACTAASPE
jgi:hypothetical protein